MLTMLPVIILGHGPCGPTGVSVYCTKDALMGELPEVSATLELIAIELLRIGLPNNESNIIYYTLARFNSIKR